MAPINTEDCKYFPTDDERQILHRMLDKMCDEGEVGLTWESFLRGDKPYTFQRKRMRLFMQISENLEVR